MEHEPETLEQKINRLWLSCVAIYHYKHEAKKAFFSYIKDNPDEFAGLTVLTDKDLKKKRRSGIKPDLIIFDDELGV